MTTIVRNTVVLLDRTVECLENALPGQIFWHWYLDTGLGGLPTLLLMDRARTPPAKFIGAVGKWASQLGNSGTGPRSTGTMEISPGGPANIVADRPDPRFPPRLASIVLNGGAECPPLRRLAGFRYGAPSGLKDVEADWQQVLPAGLALSSALALFDVASALRVAKTGDTWRFALLDHAETPVFVLQSADRDFKDFRESCARVATFAGFKPTWIMGQVALREDSARFQVAGEHRKILPRLADWLRSNIAHVPELSRLVPSDLEVIDAKGKRIRLVNDEKLWSDFTIPGLAPDYGTLRRLSDVLRAVEHEDSLRFLFTPKGFNGAPVLYLSKAEDDETFKKEYRRALGGVKPQSRALTGVAVINHDENRLDFRSELNAPPFLSSLAGFVAAAEERSPIVGQLRYSTYTVVDADQNPVKLYNDPALWEA